MGRPGRAVLLRDGAVAVVLAALLAPTTVSTLLDDPSPARVLTVVLVAGLHLAVAAAHVAPRSAYAVGLVACAALLVQDVPYASGGTTTTIPAVLLPSTLVLPVLLYAVLVTADRRSGLAATAVAGVGAVAVLVRVLATGALVGRLGAVFVVLLGLAVVVAVALPWAAARTVRARAEYAERTAARDRADAARDERERIAREMHDVVAHSLAVMVAQAEAARMVLARDPERAGTALGTVAETGRTALAEMRGLVGVLRAEDDRAPTPGLAGLDDLVRRVGHAGVRVGLTVEGAPRPLERRSELAVYRVVQEALTNVLTHAGPSARADVLLRWTPDALSASVTDRGGTGPGGGPSGGHGLVGMRERAGDVGGTVHAGPTEGGGYAVRLEVPLR